MAARTPELTAGTATRLAPLRSTSAPRTLETIEEDLERARAEVAVAVDEVETAARRLATTDYWKSVALRSAQRRPLTVVAGAFVGGWLLGRLFTPRSRVTERVVVLPLPADDELDDLED